MKSKKPTRLLKSRAYAKASNLVKEILSSPERASKLITKAQNKLIEKKPQRLAGMWDSVLASFRLIKSYVSGEYRDISFESLALIVASIIYFVMPFDVVPDFIMAMGFADDAVLISWTLRAVADDLERFIAWEDRLSDTDSSSASCDEKNTPHS